MSINEEERAEIVSNVREVRDSGAVNMLDKSGVVNELYNAGYDFSAEQIGSMNADDYVEILKEI